MSRILYLGNITYTILSVFGVIKLQKSELFMLYSS